MVPPPWQWKRGFKIGALLYCAILQFLSSLTPKLRIMANYFSHLTLHAIIFNSQMSPRRSRAEPSVRLRMVRVTLIFILLG